MTITIDGPVRRFEWAVGPEISGHIRCSRKNVSGLTNDTNLVDKDNVGSSSPLKSYIDAEFDFLSPIFCSIRGGTPFQLDESTSVPWFFQLALKNARNYNPSGPGADWSGAPPCLVCYRR